MASYARDIYFGVRVEDRATRPLRRIARDFQLLGKQGLAQRKAVVNQAKGAELAARARVKGVSAQLQEIQGARTLAAQAVRQQKAIDSETRAKLRSAGVSQQMRRLDERRITLSNQLGQAEMALAQRRTQAGQTYERLLKRVGKEVPEGIPPAQLAKARKGILAPGMTEEQLVAQQQKLLMAQATLNKEEEKLATSAGLATGALERQREATAALGLQDEKLAAQEAALRDQFAAASIAHSKAIGNMNAANQAVERFPVDRLRGVATYLRHIGAVLGTVGAVGVFAFAAMGKSAADFSTQTTIASTQATIAGNHTVKETLKNAKVIQAGIQKLLSSGQAIATPQEQTGATYRIFSGTTLPGNQNQQLREGIKLLREFNQATTANAGLVKLDEVVSAGLTIINRFRVPLKEVPKDLNVMQAAVRYGNLNMSQFIAALNQAAPAAQSAGYSFLDVSSSIAFLSRQFTSVPQAATGYARLLQIFARPDIVQGLHNQGVEITKTVGGVHKLLPLQQIAKNILDRYKGSVTKGSLFLQNFFKDVGGTTQGTIQARKVLISYLQGYKQFDKITNQVTKDHHELRNSLRAAQASPGVKWQEFTNQLRALTLEIGTGVLPVIAILADHVGRLASWFNNLSPHTKRAIGYFGAFVSVGTLVGGILFTIAGGFLSLIIALGAFNGLASGGAMAILGAEAGIAAPELLLVVAALAGLFVLYRKYPTQAREVIKYTKQIVRQLIALDLKLLDMVAHPWKIFINIDVKLPKGLSDFFHKHLSKPVRDAINNLPGGKVVTGLYDFWEGIKRVNQAKAEAVKIPHGAIDRYHHRDVNNQATQMERAVKHAAKALGVDATPSFRKLFANLVVAKRHYNELKDAHASQYKLYLAQMKIGAASAALDANATKQQIAAAEKASTAAAGLGNDHKKYSNQFIINEAKKVAALSKTARHEKTFAAWKRYYAALNKLQGNASDSQLAAVEKMFNLTDSAADTATKKVVAATNKMHQKFQQVLQNLQSQYQTFYQQNQNAFGTLFNGPYMQSAVTQNRLDWGQVLNMSDLSKDLKSQVKQFRKWRSDINKLRKLGLPKSLVDQIAALGPEAGKTQAELLIKAGSTKAGRAQLAQYKQMWKAGQKDVHDATMADVQSQLKDWRRHGKRIALAIAAGLRDENTVLESALRKMIAKAFPEFAAKNVNTPARSHPGKQHSTGTSPPKVEHHHKGSHTTEYHDHIHVTAPKNEHASVKTKVRHAHFVNRTRSKYVHRD